MSDPVIDAIIDEMRDIGEAVLEERFAKALNLASLQGMEEEREACAKIVETWPVYAVAIRARATGKGE